MSLEEVQNKTQCAVIIDKISKSVASTLCALGFVTNGGEKDEKWGEF